MVKVYGIPMYTSFQCVSFLEPKQVRSVDPPSTTSESVRISWERSDNVSSYRVTLEKHQTNRQAESRYIDAEDPTEVIFDGLDGGTQYRAAIYSVNGPKESNPHILEFCTSMYLVYFVFCHTVCEVKTRI